MLSPTTIPEQIEILTSRGLSVDDHAERILLQYGYYNLVNGYKTPFLDQAKTTSEGHDVYREGSSLNQILALYLFDAVLRRHLFYMLNNIEVQMKSAISLHFSLKYGSSHWNYLTPASFTPSPTKRKYVNSLISTIQKNIGKFQKKNPHPAICHAVDKYNQIPLWVLNTILSFGVMSNFYDNLKDDMKQRIANDINPAITPSQLSSILYFLTKVRNKCAHNNRLYSHKIDQMDKYYLLIPKLSIHKELEIPCDQSSGQYKYGQDDLLAVLICASLFFDKNKTCYISYHSIEESMQDLVHEHPGKFLSQLPPDVLSYLRELTGFKTEYLMRLQNIFH